MWVALHGFSQCFIFSWQILMFCRSVCFYYSSILTNPPLCSGREDVYLCFDTSKEIMKYRKGEERESVSSLASPFPNIRLCTRRGLNVGIWHEALALAVVLFYPAALVQLLPQTFECKIKWLNTKKKSKGRFILHRKCNVSRCILKWNVRTLSLTVKISLK